MYKNDRGILTISEGFDVKKKKDKEKKYLVQGTAVLAMLNSASIIVMQTC